ncbi:hypothetical protein CAL29_14790 [Bordetella genomosp. 10]|uniref:TauD/TfdA-like domain-containing protein n=1 Tax=Bordetella genomosp. 10 TaxID=1416804 RepID=A0A261SBK3_9BORD|nr:TauD/TfdA family dioxygenase [Bordetella genomosp. 10]OZI34736.1 hypothetical protein CAL29_14790 [Bordetella genomosp. 10]
MDMTAAGMPLVIEYAAARGLDACAWADANQADIDEALLRHGAILFRGFPLQTPAEFEAFASRMVSRLYGDYGDLPKKEGGQEIYQSTPYPEREMILYHNESSHLERWPGRQLFFCELPSTHGGATPIVDCQAVYRALPADMARDFARKHLLYVRNFIRGLDVRWQDFYGTSDRAQVETRLRGAGAQWEWLDGDALRTRMVCPAVIVHPRTGLPTFFNQVQLHHISSLDAELRESLLSMVAEDRLPRNVYYGDGSPISDATMAVVGATYERLAVRFTWQRGDVLLLDNMRVAHARDPYEGPRKIAVAMGDMVARGDARQLHA